MQRERERERERGKYSSIFRWMDVNGLPIAWIYNVCQWKKREKERERERERERKKKREIDRGIKNRKVTVTASHRGKNSNRKEIIKINDKEIK